MKTQYFDEQKARERILELTEFVEKRSVGSTQILAVTKHFNDDNTFQIYPACSLLIGC